MQRRKLRKKNSLFLSLLWKGFFSFFKAKKKKKTKKIRTRTKKTFASTFMTNVYKRQKIIFIITWLWILLVLGLILAKKTIFSERYTIDSILYNPATVQEYNNPEIFSELNDALIWQNYYTLRRWWKETILYALSKKFPLVKDFTLELQDNSVWYVSINYNEPTLIFLLPAERRYAAFQNKLYWLWIDETLWSDAPVIELPRYTESLDNIDWIFYKINEEKLFEIYSIITNTLWRKNIGEIIYLPWWQKFFLSYKSKRLYIHANKDVNVQLAKLIDLENFYELFENLWTIDLWSIDDSIVRDY